jgi:hypothetical protein
MFSACQQRSVVHAARRRDASCIFGQRASQTLSCLDPERSVQARLRPRVRRPWDRGIRIPEEERGKAVAGGNIAGGDLPDLAHDLEIADGEAIEADELSGGQGLDGSRGRQGPHPLQPRGVNTFAGLRSQDERIHTRECERKPIIAIPWKIHPTRRRLATGPKRVVRGHRVTRATMRMEPTSYIRRKVKGGCRKPGVPSHRGQRPGHLRGAGSGLAARRRRAAPFWASLRARRWWPWPGER